MLDVVCALITREESVLLCQRADGHHLAGWWEFPGGKVEEGESAADAVRREIEEELACLIEIMEKPVLPSVEHDYPDRSLRLQGFRSRLADCSPEPCALEHAAIDWVPFGDVEEVALAEADRKLWNAARGVIEGGTPVRDGEEG